MATRRDLRRSITELDYDSAYSLIMLRREERKTKPLPAVNKKTKAPDLNKLSLEDLDKLEQAILEARRNET